jgi:hypothetical protein
MVITIFVSVLFADAGKEKLHRNKQFKRLLGKVCPEVAGKGLSGEDGEA